MRHAWVALMLVGCEPMPSSGDPFSPVKVEPAVAPAAEPDGEPWFDEAPTVVFSSEDMDAALEADGQGEPVPEPGEDDVATAADAEAPPVEAAVAAAAPAPSMIAGSAPSMAPTQPMVAGSVGTWPVRLVRTLPDTYPPRAILGLPDGREIVVTPGSMVPDQGLVVVAIGRESAQLAQVSAQGDHAAIQPVMLSAQY